MLNDVSHWVDFLKDISQKDYFIKFRNFIDYEYKNNICYPLKHEIFNAFFLTPLEEVKVVIIGQDPYHEPHQAMGLAFSVPKGLKIPPSLKNIYKEIENELHLKMDFNNGDLSYLAKQGVLLLNSTLTVRNGQPLSHHKFFYEELLKDILFCLNKNKNPIVFVLWGDKAKKLGKYIIDPRHLILKANHPSPLSANRGGFFGTNHFIKINDFLAKNNQKLINWNNKI